MRDPRLEAFHRRLADGGRVRWAWALASGLPLLGLPVLLVHARSRRTLTPLLFALASMASVAFAVATVVGVPDNTPVQRAAGQGAPQPGAQQQRSLPVALPLLAIAAFVCGHRLGQDRAARDAARWLSLDE